MLREPSGWNIAEIDPDHTLTLMCRGKDGGAIVCAGERPGPRSVRFDDSLVYPMDLG